MNKLNNALGAGYILVLLLMSIFAYMRPFYNWDMLPYVASALSLEGTTDIHSQTYTVVKNVVPESTYNLLTEANAYRVTNASDPKSFAEQLPFYTIKPLYIFLVYAISQMGINMVSSSVLVSIGAYFGTGILLFLWIRKLNNPYLIVGLPFLMCSAPLLNLARLSTPDALSTLLQVLAMYLLLQKRALKLFSIVLILCLLARPDNIIFIGIFLLYFTFLVPKDSRIPILYSSVTLIVSSVIYFVINKLAGNYGWSTLFLHSFKGYFSYPAEAVATVGVTDMISAYKTGLITYFKSSASWFILLAFFGLTLARRSNVYSHLIAVMALITIARFILFPYWDDRFYAAQYLLIFIAVAYSHIQSYAKSPIKAEIPA